MIRIEQNVFLLIYSMKYEMEMSEQVQECHFILDHVRYKINSFSKIYWMETILYNQPRIEFDMNIWNPCIRCIHCELVHYSLQGQYHPYFMIKEEYGFIILQKKTNLYENKIKKKTGWLSSKNR